MLTLYPQEIGVYFLTYFFECKCHKEGNRQNIFIQQYNDKVYPQPPSGSGAIQPLPITPRNLSCSTVQMRNLNIVLPLKNFKFKE